METPWACFPFSRAILFKLALPLGCFVRLGPDGDSGFSMRVIISVMGFSGRVISWASWMGELGRPTSEDSSLASLPEALALC